MHNVTGKLAAVVGFNKEFDAQVAKGVAMQVASMNPVAVSADSVPQSVIDTELKTAEQKTKEELVQKAANLPEQMVANIAKGRLQKFFKEQTLTRRLISGTAQSIEDRRSNLRRSFYRLCYSIVLGISFAN